jgi:hypothetical protein
MSDSDILRIALNRLDLTLGAMAEAVRITAEHGPHKGMAHIAHYMDACDAVDAEADALIPADWLTRWKVSER